jgi:hypothetical protein
MSSNFVLTQSKFNEIRRLTNQKVKATPGEEKGIRQKIRNLGFYWTDTSRGREKISGGYTVADLDGLVASGEITITN